MKREKVIEKLNTVISNFQPNYEFDTVEEKLLYEIEKLGFKPPIKGKWAEGNDFPFVLSRFFERSDKEPKYVKMLLKDSKFFEEAYLEECKERNIKPIK